MSNEKKKGPVFTAAEKLPEDAAKALKETAESLQNLADAADGNAAAAKPEEPDDALFDFEDDDPLSATGVSKKSLVIFFLIDTSRSMVGKKIGELNTVMEELSPEIRRVGEADTDVKIAVLTFGVFYVLGFDGSHGLPQWWQLSLSVVSGLASGVIIGKVTEYYTSHSYKPTQKLAESAQTGSATVIINGVGLGMRSSAIPVITIAVAILLAYGFATGFHFSTQTLSLGLYGISIAAVGMLSTLGITLATDAYGPIADNAGGNAQMSELDPSVREKTDILDSLGNTTAATGKGFAIGSAALTALALIANFAEKMETNGASYSLSLMDPCVLVGIFIGAMLPFLFSAMTMSAVGRAAQSVVVEVRRQFNEIKGLLEGKPGVEADYARCVDLCSKSSLKEMVAPAIVGIASPIIVGVILGGSGVIGLLCGATASGFIMAVFMSNSGGAWDNAKKYIEAGHFGGKGSDNHKAAVVGDTIGDPFKDTSGPSINILIKLMSMVSIVFAGLIAKCNWF